MKKKLLIIGKEQFGYHTDTLKYCQYLKDDFDITYICFDIYENKILEDGIEVFYVSTSGSYLKRGMNFIKYCMQHIKNNQPTLIFVLYFKTVFLLGLLVGSKNIILDIRTGAVWYNKRKRKLDNFIIKIESLFFQNVTVISECLRKRLEIKKEKVHILPLGSDPFSTAKKHYDDLRLLYVGGLNNRNISETIYGLKIFLDENQININIQYDIVGYGHDFEENKIIKAINDTNLDELVTFHGKVSHNELKPFFEKSNVGICYVPITDYFNCQPSTKLFEYVNSGLVCIATDTISNKESILESNGILCKDNPSSFAVSLHFLWNNRSSYNSEQVRKTLANSNWYNIVNHNLKPHIQKILDANN